MGPLTPLPPFRVAGGSRETRCNQCSPSSARGCCCHLLPGTCQGMEPTSFSYLSSLALFSPLPQLPAEHINLRGAAQDCDSESPSHPAGLQENERGRELEQTFSRNRKGSPSCPGLWADGTCVCTARAKLKLKTKAVKAPKRPC